MVFPNLNNAMSGFSLQQMQQGYNPFMGHLPQYYMDRPLAMGPMVNPYAPLITPYMPTPNRFNFAPMMPFGVGHSPVGQLIGGIGGSIFQGMLENRGYSYLGMGAQNPVQMLQNRALEQQFNSFINQGAIVDATRFANYLSRMGIMSPAGARSFVDGPIGGMLTSPAFGLMGSILPEGSAADFNRHLFMAARTRYNIGYGLGEQPESLRQLSNDIQGYYSPNGVMDFRRSRGFRMDQLGELMSIGAQYNMLDMGTSWKNMSADQRRKARWELEYGGTPTAGKTDDEIGVLADKLRSTKLMDQMKDLTEVARTMAEMSAPGTPMSDLIQALTKMTGGTSRENIKKLGENMKELQHLARTLGVDLNTMASSMMAGAEKSRIYGTPGSFGAAAAAHSVLSVAAASGQGLFNSPYVRNQQEANEWEFNMRQRYAKSRNADFNVNLFAQLQDMGDALKDKRLLEIRAGLAAGRGETAYEVTRDMGGITKLLAAERMRLSGGIGITAEQMEGKVWAELTDAGMAEQHKKRTDISTLMNKWSAGAQSSYINEHYARGLRQMGTADTTSFISYLLKSTGVPIDDSDLAKIASDPEMQALFSKVFIGTLNSSNMENFRGNLGENFIDELAANAQLTSKFGNAAQKGFNVLTSKSFDRRAMRKGIEESGVANAFLRLGSSGDFSPLKNPTRQTQAYIAGADAEKMAKYYAKVEDEMKEAGITTDHPLGTGGFGDYTRNLIALLYLEGSKDKDKQRSTSELLASGMGFVKGVSPKEIEEQSQTIRDLQTEEENVMKNVTDPAERQKQLDAIKAKRSAAIQKIVESIKKDPARTMNAATMKDMDRLRKDFGLLGALTQGGSQQAIKQNLITAEHLKERGFSGTSFRPTENTTYEQNMAYVGDIKQALRDIQVNWLTPEGRKRYVDMMRRAGRSDEEIQAGWEQISDAYNLGMKQVEEVMSGKSGFWDGAQITRLHKGEKVISEQVAAIQSQLNAVEQGMQGNPDWKAPEDKKAKAREGAEAFIKKLRDEGFDINGRKVASKQMLEQQYGRRLRELMSGERTPEKAAELRKLLGMMQNFGGETDIKIAAIEEVNRIHNEMRGAGLGDKWYRDEDGKIVYTRDAYTKKQVEDMAWDLEQNMLAQTAAANAASGDDDEDLWAAGEGLIKVLDRGDAFVAPTRQLTPEEEARVGKPKLPTSIKGLSEAQLKLRDDFLDYMRKAQLGNVDKDELETARKGLEARAREMGMKWVVTSNAEHAPMGELRLDPNAAGVPDAGDGKTPSGGVAAAADKATPKGDGKGVIQLKGTVAATTDNNQPIFNMNFDRVQGIT